MSDVEVKIVDVKPTHGNKDFLPNVLKEHNSLLYQGWKMNECRVVEVDEEDQREGKWKRFIGWQIVYSRQKPETYSNQWDR